MRLAFLCLAVLLSTMVGCQQKALPLSSDLVFSDKNSERQLIYGFYPLEGKSWRWAKHRFAVILAVPPSARTNGASLQMHLYIPDSQITDLGPMTLNADIEDRSLPPETFAKGGGYTYTRIVSAELLSRPSISVVFTLDKAVKPKSADARELGAVISEVALKPTGS